MSYSGGNCLIAFNTRRTPLALTRNAAIVSYSGSGKRGCRAPVRASVAIRIAAAILINKFILSCWGLGSILFAPIV